MKFINKNCRLIGIILLFGSCQNIHTSQCYYEYNNSSSFDTILLDLGKMKMKTECIQIQTKMKKYDIVSLQFENNDSMNKWKDTMKLKEISKKIAEEYYSSITSDASNIRAVLIQYYSSFTDENPILSFDFSY